MLRRGCARGCSYCYQGQEAPARMAVETLRAAIQLVPGGGFLSAIGAEPLADWSLTITALTKARRVLGPEVALTVTTGGWPDFTLERALQLRALGATVVASVDGPQRVHDRQRGGSYKVALAMLETLRAAKVKVSRLRATLDPKSWEGLPVLDVVAHLAHLCHLGLARGFALEVAANRAGSHFDPWPAVEEAARWYARYSAAGGKPVWHAVESHRRRMRAGAALDPRPRCGAMRSMVAVDPEGGIWPCHRMPGDAPVGHVSTGVDHALAGAWWDSVLRSRRDCARCEHWALCRGGCPAEDGPDGPLPAACRWRGAIIRAVEVVEKGV